MKTKKELIREFIIELTASVSAFAILSGVIALLVYGVYYSKATFPGTPSLMWMCAASAILMTCVGVAAVDSIIRSMLNWRYTFKRIR